MEPKDTKTSIDRLRLRVLTSAELFDAWRTIPRALVAAYSWLCWQIVSWYMNLHPTIIEGCDPKILLELCVSDAPTTQHAALVTVMVGASAAVFGLYTSTGRSWSTGGFVKWDHTNMQQTELPPNNHDLQSQGYSRNNNPRSRNRNNYDDYDNRNDHNSPDDYDDQGDFGEEDAFWDDTQR